MNFITYLSNLNGTESSSEIVQGILICQIL